MFRIAVSDRKTEIRRKAYYLFYIQMDIGADPCDFFCSQRFIAVPGRSHQPPACPKVKYNFSDTRHQRDHPLRSVWDNDPPAHLINQFSGQGLGKQDRQEQEEEKFCCDFIHSFSIKG